MMKTWGVTDVGLVRKENQDAYAVVESGLGYTVCVVCDGMGGPKGGKLASALAVEAFMDHCLTGLRPDMSSGQVQLLAEQAVENANRAVYERSLAEPRLRGMGTTLVSAVIRGDQALVTNVGDSRAYVIRTGAQDQKRGIARITKDHSVVEKLVDMGNITEEEARRHPDRNLITRALGPEKAILSDSYLVRLYPGDSLLLCSDGLVDTVTNQEMETEVLREENGELCLDRLLLLAKDRGASDNVTAVLLRQQ